MPELSLPASPEGLDIAILGDHERVVFAGGSCDKTLPIDLDTYLPDLNTREWLEITSMFLHVTTDDRMVNILQVPWYHT